MSPSSAAQVLSRKVVSAFVWGLVVGWLFALAPGCMQTCAQSCNGCCDSWGTCVALPANRSASSCGPKGAVCVDCASQGQSCDLETLMCAESGDAGPSVCGCTLPTGACSAGTSVVNCGIDAGPCVPCQTEEWCVSGSCLPRSNDKPVGTACATDVECEATLGPAARCQLQTATGSALYLGGYCTLSCDGSPASCPSGSICVSVDPGYGEPEALCWDDCLPNGGDPCRSPGYKCYGVGDGGSHACWIAPWPPFDGGPPADKVGQACDAGSDCQHPPDRGGVCLGMETDRHWQAGYCSTTSCLGDSQCADDGSALCAVLPSSAGPQCLRRCDGRADGGVLDGGAGCRAGYLCQPARTLDGGVAAGGVCAPALAPPPQLTGAACAVTADCLVPLDTVAACLPETASSGRAAGFPGGMCTRLGCTDDGQCAPGGAGACVAFEWETAHTACFSRCPLGGSTCRAGYACVGLPDGGSAVDGYCRPRCDVDGGACAVGLSCDTQSGTCH